MILLYKRLLYKRSLVYIKHLNRILSHARKSNYDKNIASLLDDIFYTAAFRIKYFVCTLDGQCIDGVSEDLGEVRDDPDLDRVIGAPLRRRVRIRNLFVGTTVKTWSHVNFKLPLKF